MDLATGAMGSLLLKLGDLLTEEYKMQTGIKQDVEYLKRELTSMYAALRKAGDVPRDQLDELVKLWADEVRDLSFIMEDIVDKFLVRVEGAEPAIKPRKIKKLMKKMGNLFTKSRTRHEISDEIRAIKVRVKEAADRRDRYRVNDVVPVTTSTVDPRLLALYKDRKELVGIDGAFNKLTDMLSDGDNDVSKKLKILSIFGFGGLGKTTLAKAVYDKLRGQYDCSAFVPVGRNPSLKKLLMDILCGIDNQMCQNSNLSALDERLLIDKLREFLESKRYFIVIDDIWDTEIWKTVTCALVDNNCASRITATTRILDVAKKAGEVYRLEPLSHDLSEELFQTRLFGGKNKCPHDLPTMAYGKILHKCGGVPLAIITMASLLVNKPMDFWSKVYNSIGFGHEDNKDIENTRKILLFSYYDLPSHLRTCLLYMSIYPEDHFIKKNTLIWKWVTEGFVHEETGAGLYEIGERYFTELVNRSMILPVETPYQGIIFGCRVHDMVLDMICLLSREENFVTILSSNEQYTSSHSNARRLAVGQRVQSLDSTRMPQVRSFIAMCISDQLPLLSCFKVLRVLDLEGVMSRRGPIYLGYLGKLVHLRYLGLQNMHVCVLPEEIGDLKLLQVLDLSGNGDLTELPCSIGLLSQLKCLNIEGTDIKVLDWIGSLTSLEELCLTRVEDKEFSSLFVNELSKLTELTLPDSRAMPTAQGRRHRSFPVGIDLCLRLPSA
ncbi:hypothetical protein CFC21_055765 [Triticum aestivum]|uniref:Uncharacterized protein n=2 Tax=Triticum aestivum TaxID=4565 RepID=A0A9R1KAD5_WHEAT|nr:hypothetical protein CFC21_055765 [Triticum aestivum]